MIVRIVTPTGAVFSSKEVEQITLPTDTGVVTILDDHMPLISLLTAGEIEIKEKSKSEITRLAVSTGALEVKRPGEINILADTAEHDTDIDVARAEAARDRAQEFIEQKLEQTTDLETDMEFIKLQAQLRKELARIAVARRKR